MSTSKVLHEKEDEECEPQVGGICLNQVAFAWFSAEKIAARRGEARSICLVETMRGRTAESRRKQNEHIC